MSPLQYTIKRLQTFLDEINNLLRSEFPYPQSKLSLQILKERTENYLLELNKLDSKSDKRLIDLTCTNVISHMWIYLPVLGFILRSTNVRNAFEVFGPALRLAGDILEPEVRIRERKTRLLLSSEWNYSPYIYFNLPALPEFSLIGLPAPESSNPLLVPLFGHELGHLFWTTKKIIEEIRPIIITKMVEKILAQWEACHNAFPDYPDKPPARLETNTLSFYEKWNPALQWALKQTEETFADFIGLYIFGSSFLYAFAYLISPILPFSRSEKYPNMKTRVKNLVKAAKYYLIKIPANYESLFEDSKNPAMTEADKLRLSIADSALEGLVEELIIKVKNIIDSSAFKNPDKKPSEKEEDRIYERLKKVVPAEDCKTLPDILNAAWRAYEEPNFWEKIPQVNENKDSVLRNLVLKNFEVYEIEQILGESLDT